MTSVPGVGDVLSSRSVCLYHLDETVDGPELSGV